MNFDEIEKKARSVGACRVAGDGLHDPGLTPGSSTGVYCTRCGDELPTDHPFRDAIREAHRGEPPRSRLSPHEIMASLARTIALSDHLGDVHEAIDEALMLFGLPVIPTHPDGTMSCQGWLEDKPSLWSLKASK